MSVRIFGAGRLMRLNCKFYGKDLMLDKTS